MPLSTTLAEYIRASFNGIRIESHGHRDALVEVGRSITTDANELPTGAELERTIAAAVGLSRYEAEGAFSLSLVRHGQPRADVLWEQKDQPKSEPAVAWRDGCGTGEETALVGHWPLLERRSAEGFIVARRNQQVRGDELVAMRRWTDRRQVSQWVLSAAR